MPEHVQLPRRIIADFCRRHHIARLSLYGSVLTPEFGPQSDIDVLVVFEPGHSPGLLRLSAMENELSALLERKVDLRTPQDLSQYFRDEVVAAAEVQYAQG
jgi:uncharacterized protein